MEWRCYDNLHMHRSSSWSRVVYCGNSSRMLQKQLPSQKRHTPLNKDWPGGGGEDRHDQYHTMAIYQRQPVQAEEALIGLRMQE